MIFSPGQTLVCQYFQKRRGIALSLGMAGTSVGALVTPPVLRLLLDTYGLNGALLVHGAIVFNVVVLGALMRPLESYMKKSRSSKGEETGLVDSVVQEKGDYHPPDVRGQSDGANDGRRIGAERQAASHDVNCDTSVVPNASELHRRKNSEHSPSSDLFDDIMLTRSGSIPLSSPFHSHELSSQVLRQRHSAVHKSLFGLSNNEGISQRRPEFEEGGVVNAKMFVSLPNLSSHGSKTDALITTPMNGNSLERLDNGTESLLNALDARTTRNSEDQSKSKDVNSSSAKTALEKNNEPLIGSQSSIEGKKRSTFMTTVASIFEVALFKEARFYLVLIVSGLSILPTILPISYLPALADDRGLSDATASYLLMVAAVCGIVARVVFGLIIDSGRVSINYVAAIGMVLLAVGMQFVSFIEGEALFMFFSVFLGLFGDAYFFVLPIWIVSIYGQVMFRKAFGFSLLLEGMFLCGGSPFCGWLRDYTGSYSAVYHFLGACSFASAVVMIIDTRLPPSKLREEYVIEAEENV